MCAERYDQISTISRNRQREYVMRQTVGEATHANSPNGKEPYGSRCCCLFVFPLLLLLAINEECLTREVVAS